MLLLDPISPPGKWSRLLSALERGLPLLFITAEILVRGKQLVSKDRQDEGHHQDGQSSGIPARQAGATGNAQELLAFAKTFMKGQPNQIWQMHLQYLGDINEPDDADEDESQAGPGGDSV